MQLKHQLKLVKFKLDNIFQLHEKLSEEGRLSTIDFDMLMKNMMEAYEFYHILKMENILWQQSDPEAAFEHAQEDLDIPEEEMYTEPEPPYEEGFIENPVEPKKEETVEEVNSITDKVEPKNIVSPNKLSLFSDDDDADTDNIEASKAVDERTEVTNESLEEEVVYEQKEAQKEEHKESAEEKPAFEPEEAQTEVVIEEELVIQELESIQPMPVVEEKEVENEPVSPAVKKGPPIETAIAINDKFIYIRELFGGDFDAYEQTIFEINKLDNRRDALDYLSNKVTDRFNWLDKEEIANDFFALVQKHFDF